MLYIHLLHNYEMFMCGASPHFANSHSERMISDMKRLKKGKLGPGIVTMIFLSQTQTNGCVCTYCRGNMYEK